MDSTKPSSTLSEISHLFLSSLRDKQAGPKRTPPRAQPAVSIDLTPEEFDKMSESESGVAAPVTAVLVSHLEDAAPAIAAYGQHLLAHNHRVGIVEIGADELRLSCLTPGSNDEPTAEPAAYFEPRHLAEAMEELNADIDRWLLVIKNPKLAESQSMLRKISHWLLITACDSEDVVAAYRSLKALSPLARPRLTIAIFKANSAEQAERVYHKISSVCEQFLHWPVERGPSLRADYTPDIHTIMHWHPPHESSASPGPHWQVIENFLSRARSDEPDISPEEHHEISSIPFKPAAPVAPAVRSASTAAAQIFPALVKEPMPANVTSVLSLSASTPASVLEAVLQQQPSDLIACPVPLPMCETAKLTVGRDRRLLLMAVVGKGLADLRSVGYAYRWLTENRQLVAMAVPQLAIDAIALPKLRLLIDHADRDGQMLAPLLQNPLVEIQPFRTLNWSGKLGLLLEAA